MIRRSIIFYSSDLTKNIAINIAKGLKGYVDVENYSYDYYFNNDTPIDDAKKRFVDFLASILAC